MGAALTLSQISLTTIERTGPDSLDDSPTEVLTRAARLLFARARGLLKYVGSAFQDFDTEAPDPRRDLHLLSLYRSTKSANKPEGILAFYSLTEPVQRSRDRSDAERHDLSLVWAKGLGEA